MKSDTRLVRCLSVLCLTMMVEGMSVPVAWAQDEAVTQEAVQEEVTEGSDSEGAIPDISASDRLMRLERIIEADKGKLDEIRADLAAREEFFDQLATAIEEREAEAADKERRLAELGGAESSEEAIALAAEIESLENMIQVTKNQSDITFQSFKTLQVQVQTLEQKIAGEERAWQDLVGPTSEVLAAELAPTSVSPEVEPSVSPSVSPTQLLVPGSGSSPAATTEPSAPSKPGTTEQIQARMGAEKAEEEAREAEAAIISFVERQAALENQIEMEQQLVRTARESRDNLDVGLATAAARLERLIAEGASKADLQKVQSTVETIQALQRENRAEIDQRREYLESLHERLANLHEEQVLIQKEAEAKRLEAEAARKKTVWLESPLHPKNLWSWVTTRGPRMLLVVVVAWVLLAIVRWSARRVAKTVVGTGHKERLRGANRADTLALSFRSAISLFIVIAAVLLVFQEAGVDIKTVLGGAAILGVAFAFGAQNLMRDYFTGFMILLEDQFELGDLITIGGITGTVERVNMRTTMLRDIEGRVHFIPNGEIKSVTNRTYVWGRAVLEIPISYKEDAERVMEVIQQVAEEFRQDPEVGDWVTDVPVMLGVDKFTESGVVIKFMVQTKPDKIFPTRRQLLGRIKKRFDEEGIEISVPHRVLIQEKSDSALT